MNDAEKKREAIRAAWQKLIAPRRRSGKAPIAPVGFDYAMAILKISRTPNGYTLEEIAECMGVSLEAVKKYRRGTTPDHIGGESLWALYDDVFGKGRARRDLTATAHLEDWPKKGT